MPQPSPLARVKSAFGEKSKLVEAVRALAGEDLWLARTQSDRGGERGLEHVSNAKLLRLHTALSFAKEKFGTHAKLVEAVLTAEGKAKDTGWKTRLQGYPVPRLLDLYRSAEKRAKKAARVKAGPKASAPKAEKGAKPAKAAAKAPKAEKAPSAKKTAKKTAKKSAK